jgi:hypothetical protein
MVFTLFNIDVLYLFGTLNLTLPLDAKTNYYSAVRISAKTLGLALCGVIVFNA